MADCTGATTTLEPDTTRGYNTDTTSQPRTTIPTTHTTTEGIDHGEFLCNLPGRYNLFKSLIFFLNCIFRCIFLVPRKSFLWPTRRTAPSSTAASRCMGPPPGATCPSGSSAPEAPGSTHSWASASRREWSTRVNNKWGKKTRDKRSINWLFNLK